MKTRAPLKSKRSLLHRLPTRSVIAAALLTGWLCAAPAALQAANYTVNVLTDTAPTTGGAGSGLAGDLRYCVTQSNYGASGTVNTITFALTGTATLSGHELVINSDLTIKGSGTSSLTLDGSNASRIFYIAPGHTVAISGMTLTHGNGAGNDPTGLDTTNSDWYGGALYNLASTLTLTNCAINGNAAAEEGGGVYNMAQSTNENASMALNNCSVDHNTAQYEGGGGIYNTSGAYATGTAALIVSACSIENNSAGGEGGGISSEGLLVNATITNCTVTGNTSTGYGGGGGVFSNAIVDGTIPSLSITGSVISGNSISGSAGGGGGISNGGGGGFDGTMTVRNCRISNNSSSSIGGGVSNASSVMVILDGCTISGNTAGTTGAGVFNSGNYEGNSLFYLNNCTIAGNTAQTSGGGVFNAASMTIGNSTICGNSAVSGAGGGGFENDGSQNDAAATVTLANTILALNSTGADYGAIDGTAVSGGFNLCDDATCSGFFTATGDLNSKPAGLQVTGSNTPLLENNGGPTQTVALLPTGAAVNAGKAAIDPTTGLPAATDQRGSPRPYAFPWVPTASGGDGSDIGAFEAGPAYTLLWQNNTTGELFLWWMNGATLLSSKVIGVEADTAWKIVGTADFNGDGNPDILWQNTSTGEVIVWLMKGTAYLGAKVIGTETDPAWKIVGTGKFGSNGKPDLLWQNSSTGEVIVWLMNGTTVLSSVVVGSEPDLSWKIVGTGNFSGNGEPDLLWQNSSTGQVVIWLMNGTTVLSSVNVGTVADTAWKISGTVDYKGDGKPDPVWQNSSNGQIVVWLMNGTAFVSSKVIGDQPNTAWQIRNR